MASFYWVGGTGTWGDSSHWSASSGGAGGLGVPTSSDNAFFDANSFSASGQIITLYTSGYIEGSVNNLDFTGVISGVLAKGGLKVYGNLIFSSNLDLETWYPYFEFEGSGDMNVTTNGCTQWGDWYLGYEGVGPYGTLKLLDDAVWSEDSGGGLYIYGGGFDANDQDFSTDTFKAEAYSGYDIPIYMGSGVWTIYYKFSLEEDDPMNGYGIITVVHETSTLIFYNSLENDLTFYFDLFQENLDLNDIEIELNNNEFTFSSPQNAYYAEPSILTTVNIDEFTVTRTANNTDTAILNFTAGNEYTFTTFTVHGYDASDGGIIKIDSTEEEAGAITTIDVDIADVSNVYVVNNTATGTASPITPTNGRDGGGNTGWFFPYHPLSVSESITVFDADRDAYAFLIHDSTANGSFTLGSTTYGNYKAYSAKLVATFDETLEQVTVIIGNKSGSPTDNIILSVYSGGTTGDDGTLLAISTLSGTEFNSGWTSTSFLLENPVEIVNGTTYWFTFTRDIPNSSSTWYYISATMYDQDANATVYRKKSTDVWELASTSYQNEMQLQFEYYSTGLILNLDPAPPVPIEDISFSKNESLITVSENISIYALFNTYNLSKSESITVSEDYDLCIDNTRLVSVYETITATDVIPNLYAFRTAISTDRYWVTGGSSTNWSDNTNWSDTSGGVSGVMYPTGMIRSKFYGGFVGSNKVYFDANSFTAPGIVNFDVEDEEQDPYAGYESNIAKGLDCTGLAYTVTFTGKIFYIMGSCVFNSNVKFATDDNLVITGNGSGVGTINITWGGADFSEFTHTIYCYIESSYTVTYNFLDDVTAEQAALSCYTASSTGIYSAPIMTVNFNNHTFTVKSLHLSHGISSITGSGMIGNPGSSVFNLSSFAISEPSYNGVVGVSKWIGGSELFNITPDSTTGTGGISASISGHGSPATCYFGTIHMFKGTPAGTITIGSRMISLLGTLTFDPGTTVNMTSSFGTNSFVANGTAEEPITFNAKLLVSSYPTVYGPSTLTATSASVSYVYVQYCTAAGAIPFDDREGGRDDGNNTNWLFNLNLSSVYESITVLPVFVPYRRDDLGILSQSGIEIFDAHNYRLTFDVNTLTTIFGTGPVVVRQGTKTVYSTTTTGTKQVTFTADNSGNSISFDPDPAISDLVIDNVSLKPYLSPSVDDNRPVKEFLTGATDEGREIIFRADTQPLQLLQPQFETFSNPLAVVTRLQRGTMMKCFVALDDGDFYEIQGTVSKGVSIVKVHSKDKSKIPTPPIARKIRISWRDGSKQLCRLIQSAILFIPGTMDYSE